MSEQHELMKACAVYPGFALSTVKSSEHHQELCLALSLLHSNGNELLMKIKRRAFCQSNVYCTMPCAKPSLRDACRS